MRLKTEIRIYGFNNEIFVNTLKNADFKSFKNLSILKTIRDSDVDECLIAETNQRVILKMG